MRHLMTMLTASACALAISAQANAQYFDGRASGDKDFGQQVDHLLAAQSESLFGFNGPLESSATADTPRAGTTSPYQVIDLARGLKARFLTRDAANHADMFSFYPLENPTHVVFCIESDRATDASGAPINPSLQTINLKTGKVKTIAYGMDRCDGIRTTPWNTVLATEESDDGGAYELLNPLESDVFYVTDRGGAGAATIVDKDGADASEAMIKRTAFASLAYEGLVVLESGVVYFGDELRPGTGKADKDGGALFKFVPATPRLNDGAIENLNQSPFVSGNDFAFRVSCVDNKAQYGQGCEVGNGDWVQVAAATARDDADAYGATGFYRPEDMDRDPLFEGDGVRFCWTNTGNESAGHFAEVMCGVDAEPLTALPGSLTATINRFLEGDEEANSFDNIAFQPGTGNLYVIEDHTHGDVWACLPDGEDRDIKTDGCLRMLSVRDASAEPTGFGFSYDGSYAILSIQHSDPSDFGDTDDIILIEGFKGDRRHHYGRHPKRFW